MITSTNIEGNRVGWSIDRSVQSHQSVHHELLAYSEDAREVCEVSDEKGEHLTITALGEEALIHTTVQQQRLQSICGCLENLFDREDSAYLGLSVCHCPSGGTHIDGGRVFGEALV